MIKTMNNKMPINTYQQLTLKNKLSKQGKQGQNHSYGECQTVARWEGGVGEWVRR